MKSQFIKIIGLVAVVILGACEKPGNSQDASVQPVARNINKIDPNALLRCIPESLPVVAIVEVKPVTEVIGRIFLGAPYAVGNVFSLAPQRVMERADQIVLASGPPNVLLIVPGLDGSELNGAAVQEAPGCFELDTGGYYTNLPGLGVAFGMLEALKGALQAMEGRVPSLASKKETWNQLAAIEPDLSQLRIYSFGEGITVEPALTGVRVQALLAHLDRGVSAVLVPPPAGSLPFGKDQLLVRFPREATFLGVETDKTARRVVEEFLSGVSLQGSTLGWHGSLRSVLDALFRPPSVSFCGQDLFLQADRAECLNPSTADLRALGSLPNLNRLILQGVTWPTGSDLSLPGLWNLRLIGGTLEDPAVLQAFPLSQLDLTGTQIRNFAGLVSLHDLTSLSLHHTALPDLTSVVNPELRWLDVSATAVRDLAPLQKLGSLETLVLRETQVNNLDPLRKCTNLLRLNLAATPVESLKPIQGLEQLQDLDISGTKVSDLAPLASLKHLKTLIADRISVKSLAALAGLRELTLVSLIGAAVPEEEILRLQMARPDILLRRFDRSWTEESLGVPGEGPMDRSAAARQGPDGLQNVRYAKEVLIAYPLRDAEKQILLKDKAVLLASTSYPAPGALYQALKNQDLPVFITLDSILSALHVSYTRMLPELEVAYLAERLHDLLLGLRTALPAQRKTLAAKTLQDLDLLTSTLLSLFQGKEIQSVLHEPVVDRERKQLLRYVAGRAAREVSLFGSNRIIDFGIFAPRAHYAEDPFLGRYYQTLIGLSAFNFVLREPAGTPITRGVRDAAALYSLLNEPGLGPGYQEILELTGLLFGHPDVLTPLDFGHCLASWGFQRNPEEPAFLDSLATCAAKRGQIQEEAVLTIPGPDRSLRVALLDRVSPLDTLALHRLVFDRLRDGDKKIERWHPSGLDLAYILGDDFAGKVLEPERQLYGEAYQRALETERAHLKSVPEAVWDSSLYQLWLKTLRDVRIPQGSALPALFHSPGFERLVLNTRLVSWAHLRHDTLAYIKEESPGGICEHPDAYLEPQPAAFGDLGQLAEHGLQLLEKVPPRFDHLAEIVGGDPETDERRPFCRSGADLQTCAQQTQRLAQRYFRSLQTIMGRFVSISEAEIAGQTLSEDQQTFLKGVMDRVSTVYVSESYNGWYPELVYDGQRGILAAFGDNPFFSFRPTVATLSVSQAPTSPALPSIRHVGTGDIKVGLFLLDDPSGKLPARLFAGPLSTYFEFTSPGTVRLNDQAWRSMLRGGKGLFAQDRDEDRGP